MSLESAFSPDYTSARARFRSSALRLGARLEEFPIGQRGPDQEPLTIDVAMFGSKQPRKAVVVTSGTHGVEGFMGSAVQAALMEESLSQWHPPPDMALILIHAVNPYGFSWIRRTNEHNVDQNRNFLLQGETYEGFPKGYDDLNAFLNPKSPPEKYEFFRLRAVQMILKKGLATLKNSVAGGQYEFPKGLMFGGNRPSKSHAILKENLPRWVGGCTEVLHVDFHTGLGRSGTYKLLVDHPWESPRTAWLKEQFGEAFVEPWEPEKGVSYSIRGGLGTWCKSLFPDVTYDVLVAEFGTYSVLKVLQALRDENRAHFWCSKEDPQLMIARERLREVFCPTSPKWRTVVVGRGLEIIRQAMNAITAES